MSPMLRAKLEFIALPCAIVAICLIAVFALLGWFGLSLLAALLAVWIGKDAFMTVVHALMGDDDDTGAPPMAPPGPDFAVH